LFYVGRSPTAVAEKCRNLDVIAARLQCLGGVIEFIAGVAGCSADRDTASTRRLSAVTP
jgi:hypothetical protein